MLLATSSARRRPARLLTYEDMAIAFGARGYWKLDDTGSVAIDSSGNGYHGSYTESGLVQGIAPIRTGAAGALRLDTFSGGVSFPNSSNQFTFNTGDFTLEVIAQWIESALVFGSILVNGILSSTGSNAWRMVYRYGTANDIPRVDFSSTGISSFPSDSSGVEHIVFRLSGETASMLRNGVVVDEQTTSARPTLNPADLRMGGGFTAYPGSYGLRALVSDVAIYPSALTDAQILAHARAAGLA